MTPPRRATGAGIATAVIAAVSVSFATPAVAETRNICFPYEGGPGVAPWVDSFGDSRGGGSRRHEGQDLMSAGGEKMRPLVSTVDGTVREIVYDNASGNRVVIQDDEGWFYVYLHLNNDTPGTDDRSATRDEVFAPGLEVGRRVKRCEVIAYVGDSGNAEGASPHLHFEIRRPIESTRPWAWSSATPINPADSLRAATTAPSSAPAFREPSANSPRSSIRGGRWAPFASVTRLVERQYLDLYGRPPTDDDARSWADRLTTGADDPASFITGLLSAPDVEPRIASVVRLYWAYFDRVPDAEGLLHWVARLGDGATLDDVSEAFAASHEFQSGYGALSDSDFVGIVYRNLLDREPDAASDEDWTRRLSDGSSTRGAVMVAVCESPEHRIRTASRVQIVVAYVTMLGRSPEAAHLAYLAARGPHALVADIYASEEYRARIVSLPA